jgi:aldose sugar dehydrogenase
VDDPRLEDRVAGNRCKFDITESESLLFGRNFGVATDIETGPNSNLFVVSLSNGSIYEIRNRRTWR